MKKILSSLLVIAATHLAAQQAGGYKIIAYYTGKGETIQQYPVDKLTHIIFSFLKLQNDTLTFRNEDQRKSLQQLVQLKTKYPQLKIMVSIGGWGGCAPCSDLFGSEEHRATFSRTAVALFKQYNIDGLDLDWEYPVIEGYPGHKYGVSDKENFTALVKNLRHEMGDQYLLSFAAGGFTKYLEQSVDWNEVATQVDFINLMTYDLMNGYSTVTGHHTPLSGTLPGQETTERCVDWLLNKNIASQKLIIGAAFYARVWENVPDSNNGLYQPGKFKTSVPYRNFASYFNDSSGFTYHWDNEAKAPFQYNSQKKLFATFDDERSIGEKSNYIRNKRLGGMMFWELSEDLPVNGLVDEMFKMLRN